MHVSSLKFAILAALVLSGCHAAPGEKPSPLARDCAGEPGGSARLDACGECAFGQTGHTACEQDCAGTWGGSAELDECGECVAGDTGKRACVADCAGVLGGDAHLDECGACVDETTSGSGCAEDCAGVSGGTAFLDACGACAGGNTGRTACATDCRGVAGGSAYVDDCGQCVGDGTGQEPCLPDCHQDWGGSAFIDDCGACVGGATGRSPCGQDCAATFGGSAYEDECGVCVGGSTGRTPCTRDCDGLPGGSAFRDACGACVGGNTGRTACAEDCHGQLGGTAFIDECGACVGGATGRTACELDCFATWGGTAVVDRCGMCAGGATGRAPCAVDCAGVWGGSASLDRCQRCSGGTTGQTACAEDCAGVLGGSATLDACGACVGGNTGRTACTQDCNRQWGGLAQVDACGQCAGGNTGRTACVIDCHGVPGGRAEVDGCGQCAGGSTGRSPCARDCSGELGGSAEWDGCGQCVGGNTGLTACEMDCAGAYGGTAFIDHCDECVGGDTFQQPCRQDCAGTWGGSARIDECNTCVGGTTGRSACAEDCAQVLGGTAFVDACGACVEGTTGLRACTADCHGDFGGSAAVDACGECSGGATGRTPCALDCAGQAGGTAQYDACGACVGGTTGQAACTPVTCRVPEDYATPYHAIADRRCQVVELGEGRFFAQLGIDRPVVLRGRGRDRTVLHAAGLARVLFVAGEQAVVQLEHLSITEGASEVGGIEVRGGTLHLDDVRVFGNRTEFAYGHAGVSAIDARLEVRNSAIDSNRCSNCDGAGLYARNSELRVLDSRIANNVVDGGLFPEGAGLHVHGGSLYGERVTFADNHIQNGGGQGAGLYVNDAAVVLVSSVFEQNRIDASASGAGGVALAGHTTQSFVLRDTVMRNNEAHFSAVSPSGGIVDLAATGPTAHLEYVSLANNRLVHVGSARWLTTLQGLVRLGGKVLARHFDMRTNVVEAPTVMVFGGLISAPDAGLIRIVDSQFVDNEVRANALGGAVAWSEGSARLVFSRSLIAGTRAEITSNERHESGSLFDLGWDGSSRMLLESSTVHDNRVHTSSGAGLRTGFFADANEGTLEFVNATITDNVATDFTGFVAPFSGAGLYAAHSVFAGNEGSSESCGTDQSPVTFEGHHNLFFDRQRCEASRDPRTRFGIDPALFPLSDQGGPTPSRAPRESSPLLDGGAATCRARPLDRPITLDQRGQARPQGRACDLGSVETR